MLNNNHGGEIINISLLHLPHEPPGGAHHADDEDEGEEDGEDSH